MASRRVDDACHDEFEALGDLIRRTLHVLVLTGAGVSKASGLPTYRGAGGIYERTEIADLHDAARLPDSLPELWEFWGPRRATIAEAEPNAAHRAIADYQGRAAGRGRDVTLVTQNVDDLHERGGSDQVAHLHGTLFATRCITCTYSRRPDLAAYADAPTCPECGDLLRPDVVLFGERLDLEAERIAKRAARECDLLLAVGTSGEVSTAAYYARFAADVGAELVIVDPSPYVPEIYDVHVPLPAEDALPRLLLA